MMLLCYLNLFQSNFPFLYPQKTSENKNFSAGIEIEHGVKRVTLMKTSTTFGSFNAHVWHYFVFWNEWLFFSDCTRTSSPLDFASFNFSCRSLILSASAWKRKDTNTLNNEHTVVATKALSPSFLLDRDKSKTIHQSTCTQGEELNHW